MRVTLRQLFLSTGLLLVFSACSKNENKGLISDSATSGAFELAADENLKPVIDSLITAFNKETPNAKVTVHYVSSAEALDALLSGKNRLAILGRTTSPRERRLLDSTHTDLPEFDIALSAVAVITSKNTPINDISLDSLKSVIGGKTVTRYFTTSHLSSTETIFDSIFDLKGGFLQGNLHRFKTTDSVISAVKTTPGSIGFISSSWANYIHSKGDSTLKILPISTDKSEKPIMLHPAYLYQGIYPLASRVCGFTTEVPNSIPRGFLAYVMSPDGQKVFLHFDVLPRTQIIKLVPPK